MNFNELIAQLSEKLNNPLNPEIPHGEMIPSLPTGQKVKIKHTEPSRKSAVLILLYENEGIRFPLIQRPNYKGTHGGQISLPGGKKEEQDRNLLQTALRETKEEIGIEIPDNQVIGFLSDYFVVPSNFIISPYVAYTKNPPHFIPEEREVAEIFTPKISELNNIQSKITKFSGDFELKTPYFNLCNRMVWGATGAILNELIWILKEK